MQSYSQSLEEMISIGEALGKQPSFESLLLLGYVLKKNKAFLFAHPEVLLTNSQWLSYQSLLQERGMGVPIAYLTGEREFWSLNLKVSPATLIPRHDTELLVELTLKYLPDHESLHLLDLGTGSGAIALALAKERPHWHIDACDLSEEALAIAQENAIIHKLNNISFYHSNWFSHIPSKTYDAIVSNPPYIAEEDPHLTEGDLRFEPRHALVSSQKGLADLQWISSQGHDFLKPKGLLLLEHGFAQKEDVQAILNQIGYKKTHCWQDLQGHDRVSGGWKEDY